MSTRLLLAEEELDMEHMSEWMGHDGEQQKPGADYGEDASLVWTP